MGVIREWIREDIGLLDDDRYADMTDACIATWELLYKMTGRMPGEQFKNLEHMASMLRRYGRHNPMSSVKKLEGLGWFVPTEEGGLRIRGWDKYQRDFTRGLRNDRRPTTRQGRLDQAAVTKAEREQREREREAALRDAGPVRPFGDIMREAGFDPDSLTKGGRSARLDEPARAD